MNIVLFEIGELTSPLPRSDPRARHIIEILKCREGSRFDAGQINGKRGKATIISITDDSILLDFKMDTPASPPHPIDLIVGMPRPQTARDILRDATALGVRSIRFVTTEKGERSYAKSSLWDDNRFMGYVIDGASTAFTTFIPRIYFDDGIESLLTAVSGQPVSIALDNYEASDPLSRVAQGGDVEKGVTLAIGSERGWSDDERNAFRDAGYRIAHLGDRVLRTEVAVIAGVTVLLSAMSRV